MSAVVKAPAAQPPASPTDALVTDAELDALVLLTEARLLLAQRQRAATHRQSHCACCGYAVSPRATSVAFPRYGLVYHADCAPGPVSP